MLCSDLSTYTSWIYKFLAGSPECRYRLCQCDSALAACVKKASPSFNPAYKYYNKKTCKQLKRWTDIYSTKEKHHGADNRGSYKIGEEIRRPRLTKAAMFPGRQHERLRRSRANTFSKQT